MQLSTNVIVLISVSLLLSACEQAPSSNSRGDGATKQSMPKTSQCQLTMGWDPWEPYMYLTPNDEVSGLDIELISQIANKAQCKISLVQDDWVSLLEKLKNAEIDMVAGASKTENRKEFALFSEPYRKESFVLYAKKELANQIPLALKEILEKGLRVGITTDYYYGEQVTKWIDDPTYTEQFVATAYSQENYFKLISGEIDLLLEDPFVGSYNIKRKGLENRIIKVGDNIHRGEVHIMFSIKTVDHTIVTRFNKELATMKSEGSYQRTLSRYLDIESQQNEEKPN